MQELVNPRNILSRILNTFVQNYLLISFLSAFLLGAVLMLLVGVHPLAGYGYLILGGLGNPLRLSGSLMRMIPLVLGGLGVIIAFQAGVYNFGGSGQALTGYFMTAFFLTSLLAFTNNSLLGITLCLLGGVIGGALTGFLPALLKTELNVSEIVVCIMLNYLVALLGGYLISIRVIRGGLIPVLFQLPILFGYLHSGFLIIMVVPVLTYLFLFRTVTGYKLRTVGLNPLAAKRVGMNPRKLIWLAMIISGGLLGLAGSIELLGVHSRFYGGYTAPFGLTSIIVALFGFSNPLFAVIVGFILGALESLIGQNMRE